MKVKKPELAAPAGDWGSLYSAVEAGADSVYFGVKGLNMRNLAVNFDILELKKLMAVLHKSKKKGYLALNVIAFSKELTKIRKILKEAKKAKVDAVILWDMGVFALAKELGLRVHLSTQASASNYLALKNYSQQGVRRAVLARECGISDIKEIVLKLRKEKINCEVEAFIHGAMCVSISGRCFLSQYSFSKSANRGECLQPCRREFLITDIQDGHQYEVGRDYVLSPKDLCTIDFIDKLIEAGVSAFKIEGRIRSSEYAKVVTSVYRRAIDAYFNGKLTKPLKKKLKNELSGVYNRGFSSGFYLGAPKEPPSRELEHTHEKIYSGQITRFFKKIGVAEVKVSNEPIKKGDEILCVGKNTPASFAIVDNIQMNHKFVNEVKKGEAAGIKLPFIVKPKDKVFIRRKKADKA
ncbi:MAG: U32 family peptidase [Candidatus Omnitrophota bacterium]